MYLRTRAHLRRVRQDPRNFSLSYLSLLSFSLTLCFPYPPFFSSLLVTLLLKRSFPYCFFGKYAEPSSLLLCNESGITARRELSKFIRPMRSRRYESPLDRPTRNFIRYIPGRPRRTLRGISRQRARTDEHNHRTVPPEWGTATPHSCCTSLRRDLNSLLKRPSGEPATTPGTKPPPPPAPAIHPQRPRYKGLVFMYIVDWHVDLCTSVILCVLSSPV